MHKVIRRICVIACLCVWLFWRTVLCNAFQPGGAWTVCARGVRGLQRCYLTLDRFLMEGKLASIIVSADLCGGASSSSPQVHCHLHGLKRGSAPDDSPHTRGPAVLPPVFMQPHQCPEWDGWLWRGLQTWGVSQKGPLRCSHLCGGRTV